MLYILVNIFRILTNLFETLIPFFRKTSVIAVATLHLPQAPPHLGGCVSSASYRDLSSLTPLVFECGIIFACFVVFVE